MSEANRRLLVVVQAEHRDAVERTSPGSVIQTFGEAADNKVLLRLAHEHGCEAELARAIERILERGELPDPEALAAEVAPPPSTVPKVNVPVPAVALYDALLKDEEGLAAVFHAGDPGPVLQQMRNDGDAEVREIAEESIATWPCRCRCRC